MPPDPEAAAQDESKAPPLPRRLPPALLLLLLVVATLIAYLPAMRSSFIWDDDRFLTDNPFIKAPDGLRTFWLTTKPLDYFPLTSTMLWIEWRLWGMHPAGYHVVNVLLHAASAVLLWRVLARLRIPGPFDPAQRDRPEGNRMGGAWLAGLLFALHPVCVESVAWITERKNTLPLPLFLASLLLYLRFDEGAEDGEIGKLGDSEIAHSPTLPISQSPNLPISASPRLPGTATGRAVAGRVSASASFSRLRVYIMSLLLFLLALLAKTSVVMLPVVLLMCAWWRRGRVSRRDLLRAAPFFLLAAALAMVTMWYQHYRAINGDIIRTDDLLGRTALAGWAAWFYLCKAALPAGLCFVYPRFAAAGGLTPFFPAALLVAALLLLWRERRRPWARASLLAAGYFLAALLPVLGFVDIYFMKYSLVSDHWQYAALIGPVALAAAALCAPGRTAQFRAAAAVGIVLLFGALTWRQEGMYHDSLALWSETIRKNPDAWIAWNNLSVIRVKQGERVARLGSGDPDMFYNAAFRCCNRALGLHPYAEEWCNRGYVLSHLGRLEEAIRDCDRAIGMKPDLAEAWNIRGTTCGKMGDFGRAIEDLTQTIRLRPDFAVARFNRGNAYLDFGRPAQAAKDYREALRLEPDFLAAQGNLAIALRQMEEGR